MNGSRGFTYLEVLVAVVVLATATITASQALLSVRDQDRQRTADDVARHLLQDGIARTLRLPRIDDQSPVFGSETADTAIDDVDDLNGLVQTGPVDLGGLAHGAEWQRTWNIGSVDPLAPTAAAPPGSTNLLRIRITVARDGAELAATTLWLARTP